MLETFGYAYQDVIAAIEVSVALNDNFPAEGDIVEENGKYYFNMKVKNIQSNPAKPGKNNKLEAKIEKIQMNVDVNNREMMETVKNAIKYPQHAYKTVFYEYGVPAVSLLYHKGNEALALRLQEEETALEYFRFLGVDTEEDLKNFIEDTKKQARKARMVRKA